MRIIAPEDELKFFYTNYYNTFPLISVLKMVDYVIFGKQILSLMFRLITIFCLMWLSYGLNGQTLAGKWEGSVEQKGGASAYFYSMEITIADNAVSGIAVSKSEDGQTSAEFVITGIAENNKLILQEVKQLKPASPQWCLKSMTLFYSEIDAGGQLKGNWTAKGCKPGTILLKQTASIETEIREDTFSITGKWIGHLSQSDRDYGFYYELQLDEAGVGTSFIVSEGNGGSATHALIWLFDESTGLLTLKEQYVQERTDPKWKWCIKSGTIQLNRKGMSYYLEGDWSGFIEGFDENSGACAPGQVILEKPVLTREIRKEINVLNKPYEDQTNRVVKVGRTVEVNNMNIRIKIWDCGTVDGDYATLFLNGERILNNYKVMKYKKGIPVKLNAEENILILHAEDLGDIPPNTVAVSVVDGKNETVIIMNSNLKESDAILIRRFKLKQ